MGKQGQVKRKPRRKPKPGGVARVRLPARWWAWCLAFVALAAAAGLHVRARLVKVEFGYALSSASKENRRLQAERRKLSVEVATLSNPRRLRTLAVERLRLAEPAAEQIIRTSKRAPSELALGQERGH